MIRVSAERITETAIQFSAKAEEIQSTAAVMTDMASSIAVSWTGQASAAYVSRLRSLETDIVRIVRMIREHSANLQEIAGNYERAEAQNEELAGSLVSGVVGE